LIVVLIVTIHRSGIVILGHGVEGRAVLEPLDLTLVEGVRELDVEGLAVLGVDPHGHGLANGELGAEKVDLVGGVELVVVGGVGEGKRKHTLLLQVGLVLHNLLDMAYTEIFG
jgi:hypothetical protein